MKSHDFQQFFEQNRPQIVRDWCEYLRFRSISASDEFRRDCEACAAWLASYLASHGYAAEVIPAASNPLVYARIDVDPSAETVLLYGHYDVQPPEPLDLWTSDPFEPVERNGRVFARGAQDNKGQTFAVLSAIICLKDRGLLRTNVRVFIEGGEECGSPGAGECAAAHKDLIRADVLMICDSSTVSLDVATITMGLRGIIHLEVRLTGASKDLHSGVHGGLAPNPATGMSRLLASLHDERGGIAVEGYYDGIRRPSPADLEKARTADVDDYSYSSMTGVLPVGGEKGLSFAERRGFRPTIEINGITSGYQGDGHKTIIPSWARAKISSRIAGGQDPARCLDLLKKHLQKHTPEGLRLEISGDAVGAGALLLNSESRTIKKAANVLRELTGKEPVYLWEGASIPVVPALREASGGEPLLVGFGLEEDNIHAPNESFSLEQFEKCFEYAALLLSSW